VSFVIKGGAFPIWRPDVFFVSKARGSFSPKELKGYSLVSNIFTFCFRAGKLNETSGFLEGDYANGIMIDML
jgi:hypothetical protein